MDRLIAAKLGGGWYALLMPPLLLTLPSKLPPPVLPFPPSLQVRISLKVANCSPEQLPPDLYCRLRSLLLTADASVVLVWGSVALLHMRKCF